MAVTEIARGTSTANNTTVTATVGDLPAALTSGHLIAVVAKNDDTADNVFSDTDGLTWTTDDQHNHFSNVGVAIGSAQITGGVTVDDGHVFTCTMSSASRKALIVYHVDDLDTTSWVDENGRNNESSQTTVDATLDASTDEADTLVIMGACVVSDGSLGWTPGGDDGDVVDVSNRSLVTSWHEETAAGTHSESGTADAAGNFAAVVVAYIKATGGGGGVQGAASQTLPALTQDAAAGAQVDGPAAQALPALVQDSAGALEVNGSANAGLPALGQNLAGQLTVDGGDAQALPALAQDGAANLTVTADAAATLPGFTQASSGTVAVDGVVGSADNVLPALTQDAAAEAAVAGSADSALPGLGQNATGALTVTGAAAGVLGALATAAGGTLMVAGDGASVLPALSQDADGTVTADVAGAVVQTLPALTQSVAVRVFEAGLPTIRELLAGVLYVPTRIGAQVGNPKGNDQWRRLRRGQDVVVTRAQLSMFGAHPDKPDVSTSELWLLSGDSTLTPTE